MTPSPFLIQLGILLLPGVIWAHLDAKFCAKTKPTHFEFLARSLVFGLASYLVTYALYTKIDKEFSFIDLSQVDKSNVLTQAVVEQIIYASVVGLVMSLLWMYCVNYKLMVRLLQWVRATKRFGDEDLWDFVFNSSDASSEYVNVRDFNKKIVYAGWVRAFSETGRLRELLLVKVAVYDFNGNLLFEVPQVYISQATEGLHIEFPATRDHMKDGANGK